MGPEIIDLVKFVITVLAGFGLLKLSLTSLALALHDEDGLLPHITFFLMFAFGFILLLVSFF